MDNSPTFPPNTGNGIRIPVVNKGDILDTIKFTGCYFDNGRLFKDQIYLREVSYLAVTHSWGHATWRSIPGIEGDVIASDSKARFITESLQSIVGDDYFWMDIMCIDQKDKAARVAVTQYIPRIFRSARRTIFVKEDGTLERCCSEALGEPNSIDDGLPNRLTEHRLRCHEGQSIEEAMLTRLWICRKLCYRMLLNLLIAIPVRKDFTPSNTTQRLNPTNYRQE